MNEQLVKTEIDYSNREVIDTIKQTVAKGATDAQLAQFLQVCKATGLNPFLREVWCIPATNTIMTSRDGYLRVANDNPQFDGMETRVERDDKGIPVKATCTVYRKDRSHPIVCEAYFNEYRKDSNVWKQYPSAMISKVSEVLALKRSFAINGVVTEEEIGEPKIVHERAEIVEPVVSAPAPNQDTIKASNGASVRAPKPNIELDTKTALSLLENKIRAISAINFQNPDELLSEVLGNDEITFDQLHRAKPTEKRLEKLIKGIEAAQKLLTHLEEQLGPGEESEVAR